MSSGPDEDRWRQSDAQQPFDSSAYDPPPAEFPGAPSSIYNQPPQYQPPQYQPPPIYQPPPAYGYAQPAPGYGTPYPAPGPGNYAYGYPPTKTTNTMAIVSLVASISNLLICGVGSIIGLICGFIALAQIKRTGEDGRGMAIAGIVISAAFLFAAIGLVILFVVLINSVPDNCGTSTC